MAEKERNKGGRPAFVPTAEQRTLVKHLVALGALQETIVEHIKDRHGKSISVPTLQRKFKTELALGLDEANVRVARTLFEQATGGNMTAAIFWLKTRARWRESNGLELSGPGGAPLAPPVFNFSFDDGGPGDPG